MPLAYVAGPRKVIETDSRQKINLDGEEEEETARYRLKSFATFGKTAWRSRGRIRVNEVQAPEKSNLRALGIPKLPV